ncbi:MAG TPA: hydrogenase maturation protease [Terriglobales bacterium]|nr:hydrogenase maturation protease [Terriglobales bacterium]
MSGRVLVAGIGNIFLGDDAFGVEVVHRLLARKWPEGVLIKDFGIRGLDLAYAMMDCWDLVILVDAISRGADPGTLYVIEAEADERAPQATPDAHAMTPEKVLELVRSLGGKVPRTLVLGCEPAQIGGEDGCIGLSETIEASLEQAVREADRLVTEALRIKAQAAA